jgi:uncharacterized membrane protein
LLAIILVGTALRCFHLGLQSLWHDEAVSLAIADRLSLWEKLTNQGRSSHPPLYYLILGAWIRPAGINEFTARMPSMAAGVLTIPLIYRTGRRLFHHRVGLWAGLFMAVLPFQIYYAQEGRMYTLLGLLTTLSLLLFWRAIKENRWPGWLGYGLCSVLALYTHYFFVFVLLAYHLYLVLTWNRHRHLWRPVLSTDLALMLAFLPQLAIFIGQSQGVLGGSYWLGKPNPLAFFTTIYFFMVSYTVPARWNIIGMFVVLSLLIVGLYELFRRSQNRRRLDNPLNLLVLGAFLPLIMVLAISQIKPIFLERTLIICTPFLVLLLGLIVAETHWRSPVPYLTAVVGILVIISLFRLYFDATTHKPPLRRAAEQVAGGFETGDMVLHTSVGSFLPFLFYRPPAEHFLLGGEPHPRKPAETYELFGGRVTSLEAAQDYRRVWLVVALDHSTEYQTEQVAWFDNHFLLVEDWNIGGIIVRLYGNNDV